MNIVFFETMPGEAELLTPLLPEGHTVSFSPDTLSLDTLSQAADADIISVFVKSEVRKPIIDALPNLKLITTRSMGFDHIDVAYANTKNIHITNVSTYASHPVAEFTFALLLSVSRRIYHAYNQLREGTNFDTRDLKGFNLYGKTLGVVGTGRIGKNVVRIARGFGMNVIAFDTHPDEQFATETGITYHPLNELVAASDVISVHVPYSKETFHLFDAKLFSCMKKGVIFINTARGEVVDTHALIMALRNGTVWGAGLDVLEEERALHEEALRMERRDSSVDYELLTANHILIDMPNVIVTPHIAFETQEAMEEICRVTASAIQAHIAGSPQAYL